MKIVLDTNVFFVSLSSHSKYYSIYRALQSGVFDLYLSNEILNEYEEQIGLRFGIERTDLKIKELVNLPNVHCIEPFYNWQLIDADADDNKFADCAVACGADYLITNDHHFNILNQIPFPPINVIKAEDFLLLLASL